MRKFFTAPKLLRLPLMNVLVGAAYYLAAQLGLQLSLVNEQVTPLWPPTGVALVAMLLYGMRMWPGVAAGAFLVNLPLDGALTTTAITVGNVLAPLTAAWLLKYLNFRVTITRIKDALALIFPAALGCMMISATFGATALTMSGVAPFWSTWFVWWTGDTMGILLIAPALLLLSRARWPVRLPCYRWAECATLLTVTTVGTWVASVHIPNLLFLVLPCVIWAAFRYQLAGAVSTALVSSVVAIISGSQGVGAFGHDGIVNKMVTLQAFNGALALTALLLSALMEERNTALWQVVRGNKDLGEVVGLLTHGRLSKDQVAEVKELQDHEEEERHTA